MPINFSKMNMYLQINQNIDLCLRQTQPTKIQCTCKARFQHATTSQFIVVAHELQNAYPLFDHLIDKNVHSSKVYYGKNCFPRK